MIDVLNETAVEVEGHALSIFDFVCDFVSASERIGWAQSEG